jgi:hypothetical protein
MLLEFPFVHKFIEGFEKSFRKEAGNSV